MAAGIQHDQAAQRFGVQTTGSGDNRNARDGSLYWIERAGRLRSARSTRYARDERRWALGPICTSPAHRSDVLREAQANGAFYPKCVPPDSIRIYALRIFFFIIVANTVGQ